MTWASGKGTNRDNFLEADHASRSHSTGANFEDADRRSRVGDHLHPEISPLGGYRASAAVDHWSRPLQLGLGKLRRVICALKSRHACGDGRSPRASARTSWEALDRPSRRLGV